MANCHAEFQDYIRELDLRAGQEDKLRTSRDALIVKIKSQFTKQELKHPRFESQGSYALETQNRPIDGDFDLDHGVYLQHYEDDEEVSVHHAMQLVQDAVEGHTGQPIPYKPTCIRVQYKATKDEPAHHVDLAVYRGKSDGTKLYAHRENGWLGSDQAGFRKDYYDQKTDQKHRMVRLLKGWADHNGGDGESKLPSGFHMTVCVLECFSGSADRDDKAIVATAEKLYARIKAAYIDKTGAAIKRPVTPGEDIFSSFSSSRIINFATKLGTLVKEGEKAIDGEKEASLTVWNTIFGGRFEAPEKGGDSKSSSIWGHPAIIGAHGEAGA